MSEAACTPMLSRLRRQYLSLYPSRLIAKQLAQLPTTDLTLARHQPWIIERMLSGYQADGSSQVAVDRYAPALDYQLGFWKMIVDRLEVELATDQAQEEELELDDWIAERYSELLAVAHSPANRGPSTSYKTYLWNQAGREHAVTLLEAQTTIEAGSTGLRTWTASLYLATVLLHAIDSLGEGQPGLSTTSYDAVFDETPRAILELGSGTGFLSIFIAQWMAQLQRSRSHPHSPGGSAIEIWLSDLADDGDGDDDDEGDASLARDEAKSARRTPFATLRDNLAINAPRWAHDDVTIQPIAIDWCDALASTAASPERHERLVRLAREMPSDLTIVAADVIYDPDLIPPLVSCLRLFLASQGSSGTGVRYAIVAATVRNQATLDQFVEACTTSCLSLEFLRLPTPSTLLDEHGSGDPLFWNAASAWEGEEVKVMKIQSLAAASGTREGAVQSDVMQAMT